MGRQKLEEQNKDKYMIDLHTHSFLSDGVLLPSELVRRASANGYEAIAITDHVDWSNIDTVLPGIVKTANELNKYWKICVIPGVELTHIPLESFDELTKYSRQLGASIVVAHGESPVEPVIKGTNRKAIKAGVDILAHPGQILEEDVILAKEKNVYLELTTRKGHSEGNKHVLDLSQKVGANLVINTDSHHHADLLTISKMQGFCMSLDISEKIQKKIFQNSRDIVEMVKTGKKS